MFKRMTAITLAMVLCAGSAAMAQQGERNQPKRPDAKQPEGKKPESKSGSKTLKVGDEAPKMSIEEWVKGTRTVQFDAGKVYVVEFWATWCGPCIKNIPHLTEIQEKYKDKGVTIIGVAASEKGSRNDKLKKVRDFVRKNDKEMGYTVAFDADESMWRDWMAPAGKNGIPAAFIVGKDGKIAWIGHPGNASFETALKKAVGDDRADAGPQWSPIALASHQPAAKPAQPEKKDEAKKEQAKKEGPKLKVGDKAPPLSVSRFVKGQPVTGFEKGNVYVVEFWATWCGPCIAAIPHITELQKQYKDQGLKVIGVNIWESDLSKVEPFVEQMGDKMDYIVAMDKLPAHDADDPEAAAEAANKGEMSQKWMAAAGRNGIPSSFIVDREGRVAWIGHPMSMDKPLEQVINGTWDIEKEAEKARKAAELEPQMRRLQARLQQAARQQDHDGAIRAIEEMIELMPESEAQFGFAKFNILLTEQKDYDRAYAYGNTLVDGAMKDDAMGLNQVAWTIVDPETSDEIEKKDLKLALKAAQRANELTKSQDGAIMDTLAAVYHAQGDLKKALEWQRKAVDVSEGESYEEELRDRLDQYEAEAKKGG